MLPFLMKGELYKNRATKIDAKILMDFMSDYDTFIFDADGVLWRGTMKIQDADILINQLIDSGKRVIILTNNSTKTITEIVLKCQKLGFKGALINTLNICF